MRLTSAVSVSEETNLARIIALEGADRVGKQTQTIMLCDTLRSYGKKVKLVEVPVNDHLTYNMIYGMLRNGWAKSLPNLFQFVQFMNKLLFQWTRLIWLRLFYDVVILDRWKLSSIVYGDATGANKTFNRILYFFLKSPEKTIVLHGPSFKKAADGDDVYEKDSELQLAVKEGYFYWVEDHIEDHETVDNQGPKELVHERVLMAIGAV